MRIAYLIDREALGGGMEYIRRQMAAHPQDECRVFASERGECTATALDRWGAGEVVVSHLRALLQLLGNPLRRPKGRVTFVVHGIHLRQYDWQLAEGGGLKPRLCRELRRRLESYLYHRCDLLVALTETDRADILRLYGRRLAVTVEPNTLEGWVPQLADALPPGVSGEFEFIVIGRFDYQKGQDRWIRELERRKKEEGIGKKCGIGKTLFVGDGESLAECQRLAAELGVAELCVFAGAIEGADRYLKCAKCVVSPSRWEGMPYLLMKARALGCRILATECPGNCDVLHGYDKWEKLEL